MSITQADSGLFPDKYAIIQNGNAPAAYSVVAHQYNPVFTKVLNDGSENAASAADPVFSILHAGRYIFRYANQKMERFDTQTLLWTRLFPPVIVLSGGLKSSGFALSPSGDIVFVAAKKNTLPQLISSSDNGNTWSAPTTLSDPEAPFGSNEVFWDDPTVPEVPIITASSTAAGYSPSNVIVEIDNPSGPIWVSNVGATATATQWLRFEYTGSYTIDRAIIRLSPESDMQNVGFSLESSSNGTTWFLHSVNNTPPVDNIVVVGAMNVGQNARYWRVVFTGLTGDPARIISVRSVQFQDGSGGFVSQYSFIAVPRWNRIHAVRNRPDLGTQQFHTFQLNETTQVWELSRSDIWWPMEITGFRATAATDDIDCVVLTTEMPYTKTVVLENNQPVEYANPNGGIIAFTYRYGEWSDHVDVDVVEGVEDWRYREKARVTRLNGRLYISAYSSDGTAQYPVTGYRIYRSSLSGEIWSLNTLTGLPEDASTSGLALCAEGENVFAVTSNQVYRAPSTLYFGYSAVSMSVDLTDYILDYEATQGTIFQAGLRLSNATGIFDNHPVFNKNNTIQLIHKAGFFSEINGVWEKVMVQVGKSQVESMESSDTLEERSIRVTSRDLLSRMTDYVQSEQAHYFKSQTIGHDLYSDNSGTNYGGLSHTATISGSHKTENGYLIPTSTETIFVIGQSTFESNMWNGVAQVGMLIPNNTSVISGYIGVIVRGNHLIGALIPANNGSGVVGASQRIGKGGETLGLIGSWGALPWYNTPTLGRYIRVEMRYGLIKVYHSSDSAPGVRDGGRVWTLLATLRVETYFLGLYKDLPTRKRRIEQVAMHTGYCGTGIRGGIWQ